MNHTELSRDNRAIKLIDVHPAQTTFRVGDKGITKIVAYDEHGEGGYVPWIAIFIDKGIWKRIPASMCSVTYY